MKKFLAAAIALAAFAPVVAFAAVLPPSSTVTASADSHSSISPSGSVTVNFGDTQSFGIGADNGYKITGVAFDGIGQGILSSLSVTGDGVDHSISVSSVSAGGGGLIFCSGPMAPGYNVSLPGGGCGGTTTYVPFNQPLGDGTVCSFFMGCMKKN